MKPLIAFTVAALAVSASILCAQQSTPPMMIVQAAGAPVADSSPGTAAKAVASQENDATLQTAIQLLEKTKEANVEMLKKQDDMLTRLDDLQTTANQLRIFARRSGG